MINFELLKRRKKELGLSFDEIAEQTGCSRRAVIRLLNGETLYPRMDTVQAIAKALYLRPEDISTSDIVEPTKTSVADEYTEQEKRLIEAYRTLIPSMQENILEIVEGMTSTEKKKNYV